MATFFDQAVSGFLMNQRSIFGNIFQNYADTGAQTIVFVAMQIIAWVSFEHLKGDLTRYGVVLGALIFSFIEMLSALQDMLSYTFSMVSNLKQGIPMGVANNTSAVVNYPESLRWSLAIVLTLLLSMIFKIWVSRQDLATQTYLVQAALGGIVLVLVATTTINDMKTLWGRYRPYEMTTMGHLSNFTPWYHLNGANGHNSFPSGHTMSGWLYLYLTFFVPRQTVKWQLRLTWFGLAMGILTALSRVRIGAHWLSDVTVSSLLVGLMIVLISRVIQAHFVESNQSLLISR
ncbi:phosphatase PAP2 family protein [Weissella diestrammenae]|uniref:Phosphatase PAP2 family protein n=2 Tax=Weissella diestrammenae TaxID=1162633 RepID=A0A7G9T7K8_9LACO|nr:phosphatase PAP2 family protein [Weissella diestrammenae]QNN76083.1 phosphatase PAP2 family protein [Weissella diestrammenae]